MTLRLSLLVACLLFAAIAHANDFPTQARVEYVLQCMNEHGGQSYDTLYPCVCAIDKIAAQLSFAEYTEAQVLTVLRRTPGKRGGVFRDAVPNSREQVKHLADVKQTAEASCFVKRN